MERRKTRPAVVLLVEDDPGDQELTRRALSDSVFRIDLRIVGDGEEALDYLHRRGRYGAPEDYPRPDLILMDLNMPRLDGRSLLRQLKSETSFRNIPVVVLTTSQQETDIVRSYDLGCNGFVTKPVEFENFIAAVRLLERYWFELVTLPDLDATDVSSRPRG